MSLYELSGFIIQTFIQTQAFTWWNLERFSCLLSSLLWQKIHFSRWALLLTMLALLRVRDEESVFEKDNVAFSLNFFLW